MTDSLSGWLALRQAADFAARSNELTQALAEHLASATPLHVLDLGTGTGSNMRYLAPVLGREQRWLAVDQDPRLLAEAAERGASLGAGIHIDTRVLDLGALDAPDIFTGRHLVTASALLDLVSERWLMWVASECRRVHAAALFTIIYNGRNECTPADPEDLHVFDLFNRHQLTDKGLGGGAAGPHATDIARRCFERVGFMVRTAPSDWNIGPDEREFQRQLIDGWAFAAAEMAPAEEPSIRAWKERRLAHVEAGRSAVVVGHHDLLAIR